MISKWTLYKRIYKKIIIIVLNNTGNNISSGRKKSKKKEKNKENEEKKKNAAIERSEERKKTRRILNKIFTQSTDGCCEKLMLGANNEAAAYGEFKGDGNWKARAIGTYTKMEGGKYRKDSSDFHEQMYKWSDGTWRVGMHENHDPGWVKSVVPSSCPEDISREQWQFFDRSEGGPFNYVKGDITVDCCGEVDCSQST